MSEIVKGFVAKINARAVNTRKGPRTSYSVKLERENGTEVDGWISVGWDAPSFSEGDFVKVTYAKNERGYLDATEVKSLKNAPARAGKSGGGTAPPSSSGGGGGFVAGRADPRGPSIHYQNSRTAAIELVGLMLAHDALPISAAQTKAGTAKRYDEVLALVNKLTVQLFFDVETLRLTKSVTDAGAEKPAEKAVELNDDDDDAKEEADDADDEDDDE